YDHDLAIRLMHQPRIAPEVTRLVREHLAAGDGEQPFGHMAFEALIVHVKDETLLADVVQGGEIEERLRKSTTAPEDGIWYAGTKAAAIRALSIADREEAYETALAALRNPRSRDRIRYPAILMQLREERAIADLFNQMTLEKETVVRWAIGRSLSAPDLA